MNPLEAIRSRVHPLHRLRRSPAFRAVAAPLDVPVWAGLAGIDFKVRLRLVRHASYLLIRRTPEPEIVALFRAIADVYRPRVFWDVGANFGYYSWLLKSREPELAVALLEPDTANVELIRATIRRAGLPSVEVHAVAASAEDGEAEFALDPVSGATGSLERPEESFAARHWHLRPRSIAVPTVALDSLRSAAERVELVKIDVEGHEEQVLRGAAALLEEDQPIVVFECFRPNSPVLDRFLDLGYGLFDAERPGDHLTHATNYLALPPLLAGTRVELYDAWRHELA